MCADDTDDSTEAMETEEVDPQRLKANAGEAIDS